MKIPPEHRKDFAAMPATLRDLLEAELECGNEIVEVGYSFPAPPAGAYFKLANKVSSRPRESAGDLHFYDRNSSIYSGEFTDAKRFFFILEPPNPPPPTHEPGARDQTEQSSQPQRTLIYTEVATGAKWTLHFRDPRPPHGIQFALERELMTLFTHTLNDRNLTMHAKANVTGARYGFELRFEAAFPRTNCYSLRIEASWAGQSAAHQDYYRKTSDGWFRLWTRDFMAAYPPRPDEGSTERYQELCDAALRAEASLDSASAVQQAIVAAMKRGASFATAHKEGGTTIYWDDGRFVRSDYGDDPARREFANEAEFLKFLRQFYDWETSQNVYPDKVTDYEAWKLILRSLRCK